MYTLKKILSEDYFLFLTIARTEPISAIPATPPAIPYNSVVDIPEDGEGFLIAEKETDFETPVPFTDIEPDETEELYPDTLPKEYEYVPFVTENE